MGEERVLGGLWGVRGGGGEAAWDRWRECGVAVVRVREEDCWVYCSLWGGVRGREGQGIARTPDALPERREHAHDGAGEGRALLQPGLPAYVCGGEEEEVVVDDAELRV